MLSNGSGSQTSTTLGCSIKAIVNDVATAFRRACLMHVAGIRRRASLID